MLESFQRGHNGSIDGEISVEGYVRLHDPGLVSWRWGNGTRVSGLHSSLSPFEKVGYRIVAVAVEKVLVGGFREIPFCQGEMHPEGSQHGVRS